MNSLQATFFPNRIFQLPCLSLLNQSFITFIMMLNTFKTLTVYRFSHHKSFFLLYSTFRNHLRMDALSIHHPKSLRHMTYHRNIVLVHFFTFLLMSIFLWVLLPPPPTPTPPSEMDKSKNNQEFYMFYSAQDVQFLFSPSPWTLVLLKVAEFPKLALIHGILLSLLI